MSRLSMFIPLTTADEVRRVFRYDPDTGVLSRVGKDGPAGFRHKDGYWRVKIRQKSYLAHRIIWLLVKGAWPAGWLDHADMDRQNNRLENLRETSASQNRANTRAQSNSTHGIKGVTKYPRKQGVWMASLTVGRKRKHLGLYNTPEAAHAAYCEAATRYYGEFARAA